MFRLLFTLFSWIGFLAILPPLEGQVQFLADVARFRATDQPVAEVQFYFSGNSLTGVPTPDGLWRSSVDILITFSRDSQIIQFDHYVLHSPSRKNAAEDFVDVRRFALPAGTFRLDIEAFDPLSPGDTTAIFRMVEIPAADSLASVAMSDPVLLADAHASSESHALVRNGFYMEPIPHRFYGRTAELLYVYQEVYVLRPELTGDPYLFTYFIEKVRPDGQGQRMLQSITRKRKARETDPILLQMDIRQIPSGNYRLVTEVRDQAHNLLKSSSVEFQRSNPFLDTEAGNTPAAAAQTDSFLADLNRDALDYALRAVAPRYPEKDIDRLNNVIHQPEERPKRQVLLAFFAQENPNRPDKAYDAYMALARKVDDQFRSGFGYGFETDRGYRLMKYGQPNDIVHVEDEPHAPPYEIWIYDDFPFTGQRNVKFLFYNPNLAPNDYNLLHSTARNERQNPRWEIDLYGKLGSNEIDGVNIQDATGVKDQYYRNARTYFHDF